METSTETAAPAPATTDSAPAATPEPAPASPDTKRAKRDALVARVRAGAKVSAEPAPAATASEPVTAPAATSAPKPETAATVTNDAGLTERLAALEAELNETKTKLTEREKARLAPTDVEGLLDLMSENPDMSIEKLSELYLKRQDNPAHKELTAAEKRLKAIEDKIAEGERIAKEREQQAVQAAVAAECERVARGIIAGDKGRWPRVTRDERNIVEAMNDAAIRAVKKAGDKQLTQKQREDAFREALDDVEKDLADRHARYAPPDIPARRTITASAGSTGTVTERKPSDDRPKTTADRKAEILARVRRGQP